MAVRLSKIAREFNVGLSTIVEFLHSKGIKISSDPNAKLTDEDYALVAKEFSSDSQVKKESSLVDLKNTRKKKETVTIDNAGNISSGNEDTEEEEEEFISIKDEVRFENKIKIVDHIDLNPEKKTQPEPVEAKVEQPKRETQEEITEKVEEPKVTRVEVEETQEEERKVTPEVEPEISVQMEESSESTPFKVAQPALKDVKVVGTIDLDAINQRTRPPKKSKQERERDRREQKKANKPFVSAAKTEQPVASPSTDIVNKGEEDADIRKKRKRIHRQDEKIQVEAATIPAKNAKIEENKRKLKKLKKKKNEKTEISDEDIDKQIKDTFARLGSKGKSQTAKHRRDKRDAAQQKLQAELEQEEKEKSILKLTEFVTVAELATMMNISVTEVISACMSLGLFVSINQRLDAETINIVADEFGYSVEFVSIEIQEAIDEEEEDSEENLLPRPPIVTVMGHVDHGKTSLLDSIRKTNVIAGEAGGITQHIGAYNVKLSDGRTITFLDTPGHEAFTAMRARGAKVTDVVIIIVAADDNVMPQTKEAINHAMAAGVPIVFAINKVDKPNANPDKIKEELAAMNYLVEEWGGKYQSQDISAKKGMGVEDLLEKVLLEAEMLDLKANPNRNATGSIIESSLDKGRGYVATVLVSNGTLKVGDIVLAGTSYGRVKAMFNERNQRVKEAGPSEPALILGLNGAPAAGDTFHVVESDQEAREITNKREQLAREQGLRTQKILTLDELGRRIALGNFQELNIIVKGDVDGSVEALSDSLIKLSTEQIQVNVIHKGVGAISESDVSLAAASDAIIVGFQVRPSGAAGKMADQEGVDIRKYSVIYDAIEEVKAAMEGMLAPEVKEQITATIEIREVFNITKVGLVAGAMVKTGKVKRSDKARLIRDGIVIFTGNINALKRFKDDVKEVGTNFECGISLVNCNDMKVGDMIETFEEIEVKQTL